MIDCKLFSGIMRSSEITKQDYNVSRKTIRLKAFFHHKWMIQVNY